MMQRKAQAAMEFLMTYGWAILVVLAAIGALAYLDVLNPEQFLQDQCTAGNFECNNNVIGEDEATLSLVNNQPSAVTIQNVTFNGGCFNDVSVNVGETVPNRGETSLLTLACNDGQNSQGSVVEIDMSIGYQEEGEVINRTEPGRFIGTAE